MLPSSRPSLRTSASVSNPGVLHDFSPRPDYRLANPNRLLPDGLSMPSFPPPPPPFYSFYPTGPYPSPPIAALHHPTPNMPPPYQQPPNHPYHPPPPQYQYASPVPAQFAHQSYRPIEPPHHHQPQPHLQQQQHHHYQPTPPPHQSYSTARSFRPPQHARSSASSSAHAAPRYYSDPHAPAVSSFRPSGRKRAVLIGINYVGTRDELRGCVRDVTFVHHLLKHRFNFRDRDFVVLTDVETNIPNVRKGRPDRRTILSSLKWLVDSSTPGESLWFSFSGHGSQVLDTSGDESDGYDETLLPVDYKVAGPIIDDELFKIVKRVARGARLTVLLDACHSGTGLDLPYQHDVFGANTGQKVSSGGRPMSLTTGLFNLTSHIITGNPTAALQTGLHLMNRRKKPKPPQGPDPNAGEVLLFAGCKDNQTAADTSKFAKGLTTGAMTYALIEAVEHSTVGDWRNYNYRKLLQTMRQKLRGNQMSQTPQFSTSHPFDLSSPFVL